VTSQPKFAVIDPNTPAESLEATQSHLDHGTAVVDKDR